MEMAEQQQQRWEMHRVLACDQHFSGLHFALAVFTVADTYTLDDRSLRLFFGGL